MPTTSNFGWTTPADTDLVKDGAAAIRTLGNGIDTSLVDLKGGTTGQVLSKASNTDLDFTWVAQDDSNAIQNALLTTTGDTIYASSASTPARLGIGSTGQVLTVSGGVPVWATPAGGGKVLQVVQASYSTATTIATTTYTDTGLTASITPSSASSKILILVNQQCYNERSAANNGGVGIKIVRGATDIFTPAPNKDEINLVSVDAVGGVNTSVFATVLAFSYLDSPNTTSSTTYKTQGALRLTTNSCSSTWQSNSAISTITLLEIGA